MPVKEERADEAEIADLARKIAEVNRQKVVKITCHIDIH